VLFNRLAQRMTKERDPAKLRAFHGSPVGAESTSDRRVPIRAFSDVRAELSRAVQSRHRCSHSRSTSWNEWIGTSRYISCTRLHRR
jgi:hypothetical protein